MALAAVMAATSIAFYHKVIRHSRCTRRSASPCGWSPYSSRGRSRGGTRGRGTSTRSSRPGTRRTGLNRQRQNNGGDERYRRERGRGINIVISIIISTSTITSLQIVVSVSVSVKVSVWSIRVPVIVPVPECALANVGASGIFVGEYKSSKGGAQKPINSRHDRDD